MVANCHDFLLLCLTGCSFFSSRSRGDLKKETTLRSQAIEKMEAGSYEEAVILFQEALSYAGGVVDELALDICYYKALAQYLAKDWEGARETYTALISYDSQNEKAYYLRGTLDLEWYETFLETETLTEEEEILSQELLAQAKSDYEMVLEIQGEETTYVSAMIQSLIGAQELETALLFYENYEKRAGVDGDLLYLVGRVFQEAGNLEEALEYFERALADPDFTSKQELYFNQIAAYEALLDFETALALCQEYLERYPEDTAMEREYEFLLSR